MAIRDEALQSERVLSVVLQLLELCRQSGRDPSGQIPQLER